MAPNHEKMTKEKRRRTILRFLADRNVMLAPKPLYNNLSEYEGITFSYKTVDRLLREELLQEGLVEYVDLGTGYYRITDEGRAYLRDQDCD